MALFIDKPVGAALQRAARAAGGIARLAPGTSPEPLPWEVAVVMAGAALPRPAIHGLHPPVGAADDACQAAHCPPPRAPRPEWALQIAPEEDLAPSKTNAFYETVLLDWPIPGLPQLFAHLKARVRPE